MQKALRVRRPSLIRVAVVAALFSFCYANANLHWAGGTITDIWAHGNYGSDKPGETFVKLSDGTECYIDDNDQHILSVILMAYSQKKTVGLVCATNLQKSDGFNDKGRVHRIHLKN